MYKIPLLDLNAQNDSIKNEINAAISNVINKADFINGVELANFEIAFSHLHDAKYCVGTSNGTTALHLAYEVIGLQKGDEVIVPTMTFIATAEPLRQVGATPIFCDIDEYSYNIDCKKIEALITSKTKAITVVHLHGNPAQMDEIMEIAKRYNLKVVEDCAQAHLAEFNGRKVGTFGDIAAFSFYPGKNLGAFGDAGAVITNNKEFYDKLKLLVNHGRTDKYLHLVEGYNYRMDTLQAAILNVKMKYLHDWTNLRISKATLYNSLLKNAEIHLPQIVQNKKHVFHIYSILTNKRELLAKKLTENNISFGIHYPIPLHLQPAYNHLKNKELKISESVASRLLSLPIFPELKDEDVYRISELVKSSVV